MDMGELSAATGCSWAETRWVKVKTKYENDPVKVITEFVNAKEQLINEIVQKGLLNTTPMELAQVSGIEEFHRVAVALSQQYEGDENTEKSKSTKNCDF